MFRRSLIALALSAAAAGPAVAQEVKRDIQGVALGMTTEEAGMILGERGCSLADATNLGCTVQEPGQGYNVIALSFATFLEPAVVSDVRFSFCASAPETDVISNIRESFGLTPDAVIGNRRMGVDLDQTTRFFLDDLPTLACSGFGKAYEIRLTDPSILTADTEAREADRVRRSPTPNF